MQPVSHSGQNQAEGSSGGWLSPTQDAWNARRHGPMHVISTPAPRISVTSHVDCDFAVKPDAPSELQTCVACS